MKQITQIPIQYAIVTVHTARFAHANGKHFATALTNDFPKVVATIVTVDIHLPTSIKLKGYNHSQEQP